MSPPLPIVVWAVPRSCSTALERSFREREDTICINEPWLKAYYTGPERMGSYPVPSIPLEIPMPPEWANATYDGASQMVLEAHVLNKDKIVLAKDMALCIVKPTVSDSSNPTVLSDDTLRRFTHTFIIRTPEQSIASQHRGLTGIDPSAKLRPIDPGFTQMQVLYKYISETVSPDLPPPIIIDAADLVANPEGTLRVFCDSVGISFSSSMLKWEKKQIEDYKYGQTFHLAVQNSTGFAEVERPGPDAKLPDFIQDLITENMPVYQWLRERKAVIPNLIV